MLQLMAGSPFKHGDRMYFLKIVERLQLGILLPEYPPLDEVRKDGIHLVAHMLGRWDGEHIIQFLFDRRLGCRIDKRSE